MIYRTEILRTLLGAFFFTVFCSSAAQATYLTINSSADLITTVANEQVNLKGTYVMINEGDEIAKNVFPSMRLGTWAWVGSPQDMEPNKSNTWNIDETFPISKLDCKVDSRCAGQFLPLKGAFPMVVLRHYQDANGHKFSAVEIQPITIGELGAEEKVVAQAPGIQARLLVNGDGQEYTGKLEARAIGQDRKSVSISYHVPEEIQLKAKPQVFNIAPGETAGMEFELKNFSGLPGSSYAFFAILQWKESGIRTFLPVSQLVKIDTPSRNTTAVYIGGIIGVVVFSLIMFFFAVLKKKKKES